MTRLERKRDERDGLVIQRGEMMRRYDIIGAQRVQERIDAIDAEIREMEMYEPRSLADLLSDRGECVRNEIYKSLLRISLMADAMNEAAETAREILQGYGIEDFAFRRKVKDCCRLSQEIASIPLMADSRLMQDFIVDNDTFVKMCMKHADAHLKRKLKL